MKQTLTTFINKETSKPTVELNRITAVINSCVCNPFAVETKKKRVKDREHIIR